MSQRFVNLNRTFVTENDARLSIFDSALMFGDAVFEMTRTYGQKPFRLTDHLERLYASMDYALIDCGISLKEMEEATYATIDKNREALADFDYPTMHNVSRGPLRVLRRDSRRGRRSDNGHQYHSPCAPHRVPGSPVYGRCPLRGSAPAVGARSLYRSQSKEPQPYLL